jgi:hypothetical protein
MPIAINLVSHPASSDSVKDDG